MQPGLIHLYCGDGKGKTTAAMGLAIRAAGHGKKVLILQFLKGRPTGELKSLAQIEGIQVLRGKEGMAFSFQMTPEERIQTKALHEDHLHLAMHRAQLGECEVLILDEVMGAVSTGLLEESLVTGFLQAKPPQLEVVLTGRNPPPQWVELADYVTEMKKIKHPYERGIPARDGIEQ